MECYSAFLAVCIIRCRLEWLVYRFRAKYIESLNVVVFTIMQESRLSSKRRHSHHCGPAEETKRAAVFAQAMRIVPDATAMGVRVSARMQ